MTAVTVLLLICAGCETVDLGNSPADLNRCRPDPAFFYQRIWPEYLNMPFKDGKRCTDVRCHDASSGMEMTLVPPTSVPTIPLPPDWDAVYRSVTNKMQCTNVLESDILSKPDGRQTHGGGPLFAPNGPESQLLLQWVAKK